ncbi:MAG: DUF6989 domain-containing protein [Promethearchaeota archaeon]
MIINEIILGLSTYYSYERIKEKSHWYKIPISFLIMVLYLGSEIFFFF